MQKNLFGGDEQEMLATAAWQRGIKDLQFQVATLSSHGTGGGQLETEDSTAPAAGDRAARRAAAKVKAKAAADARAASAAAGTGAR